PSLRSRSCALCASCPSLFLRALRALRVKGFSTMTNDTLIHLDSIKKVFLTDEVETHALADVHFDIAQGEYVSITGPSGCGKSTLLAILGLLDTPSGGTYRLNGREVADINASERAHIRNKEIG